MVTDNIFKVTCDCMVLYPNDAKRARTGRFTLGSFSFEEHAKMFRDYCLNGYYTNVKIENSS